MGIIRSFMFGMGFGGLYVQEGTQTSQPKSYASESPVPVNFDNAMTLSAVWASTRLIAETIASLPLSFYQQTPDGLAPLTTGPVPEMFDGMVNQYQTRQEFFETYLLNLVMTGNAYALRSYVDGRLVSLMPLMSAQVEPRLLDDGSMVYLHYTGSNVTAIAAENMWHSKLFGNGIVGLSPLAHARNTMGIALAAEANVAKIFRNGGKPTGVLTIDNVLKDDQRERIRSEFSELREGRADRLMVLEGGMKYQQVSMTPQDIELLQSRRFQIEDIARWFGVPSVLINDTSGSTTWGSGIYELVNGFYKLNLRPYLERLESSMVSKLMTPAESQGAIARFDFDALTRADASARFEAINKGVNAGVLTPNEGRKTENLPPLEGGDQLLVNGNMVPISQAGQGNQTQVTKHGN